MNAQLHITSTQAPALTDTQRMDSLESRELGSPFQRMPEGMIYEKLNVRSLNPRRRIDVYEHLKTWVNTNPHTLSVLNNPYLFDRRYLASVEAWVVEGKAIDTANLDFEEELVGVTDYLRLIKSDIAVPSLASRIKKAYIAKGKELQYIPGSATYGYLKSELAEMVELINNPPA